MLTVTIAFFKGSYLTICLHAHSVTSSAHETEAMARQNAALKLIRALDAHVRARMFPPLSSHARPDGGLPPPACPLAAGGCGASPVGVGPSLAPVVSEWLDTVALTEGNTVPGCNPAIFLLSSSLLQALTQPINAPPCHKFWGSPMLLMEAGNIDRSVCMEPTKRCFAS